MKTKKPLENWNFDDVDESDKAALCWYEYTREAFGDYRNKFKKSVREGKPLCFKNDHISKALPSLGAVWLFLNADDKPRDVITARKFYDYVISFTARPVVFETMTDSQVLKAPRYLSHLFGVTLDLRFTDKQIEDQIRKRIAWFRMDQRHPSPKREFRPVGSTTVPSINPASALGWLSVKRQLDTGIRIEDVVSATQSEPRERRRINEYAKAIVEWLKTSDASKLDTLPSQMAKKRRLGNKRG